MNRCPTCSQPTDKQKIHINSLMVTALLKAYRHGVRHRVHSLRIRDLDLTRSEYGMMSCLITFGLLYRTPLMKKGEYGIPYQRVHDFIVGQYKVPAYYLTNPTTGERELSFDRITIDQVKNVSDIQDLYGDCMTEFLPQEVDLNYI